MAPETPETADTADTAVAGRQERAASRILDDEQLRDGLTDETLEMKRLKMSIERNVVTKYVKENGFGGVDMARLQRSSDAVAAAIGLAKAPAAKDLFEEGFLPPKADRMMK